MAKALKIIVLLIVIVIIGSVGWLIYAKLNVETTEEQRGNRGGPVPVEVAEVRRGEMVDRRQFIGTIQPFIESVISSNVTGRIERLHVDVGDTVERGMVVAELEDEAFVQRVNEAKAELAVRRAQLALATNALTIAEREYERVRALSERGIASESELDVVKNNFDSAKAQIEVAEKEMERQARAVEGAEIQQRYTRIRANWNTGGDTRIVEHRHVEEGDNVTSGEPILEVMELSRVLAVISIGERDYRRLNVGLKAAVRVDAFPGEVFEGEIYRLTPSFDMQTRQATVELLLANEDMRLKPGMFARVVIELADSMDATIVPIQAITRRDDSLGVFVVNEAGDQVRWAPVEIDIREGASVAVRGENISGRVVTLGQQMLRDETPIRIPSLERVREQSVIDESMLDETGANRR